MTEQLINVKMNAYFDDANAQSCEREQVDRQEDNALKQLRHTFILLFN